MRGLCVNHANKSKMELLCVSLIQKKTVSTLVVVSLQTQNGASTQRIDLEETRTSGRVEEAECGFKIATRRATETGRRAIIKERRVDESASSTTSFACCRIIVDRFGSLAAQQE